MQAVIFLYVNRLVFGSFLAALSTVWGAGNLRAAEISFRNDVQAVIAKAGCNLGTCHGNATGKGGFKMSLRGSDLDMDYAALTEDVEGRRVNALEPERSLILLKATQALAHEGGKRFDKKSWEYQVLSDWLAQGAKRHLENEPKLEKLEVTPREQILVEPAKSVQLKAIAHFSDGTERDVTGIAVYELAQVGLAKVSSAGKIDCLKEGEPTVIVRYLNKQQPVQLAYVPARPEFVWMPTRQNNFIDRQVFSKLKNLRMTPSKLCSDEVFARRLYLDLLGLPPTVEEARAFMADKAADKRERLVDKLLARPEFVDFWTLKWADMLRVEPRTIDEKGMKVFHDWIHDAVARNMPVNQFVSAIVSAQGSTYTVPQANFYRAMREANPRAEALAQIFLGTRLRCAQCHNHPFDKWTQDDYFNWSAVFSRVDYKEINNTRLDKSDKHEFIGEQIVQLAKEVSLVNPRTGDLAKPKLLGADNIESGKNELEAAAQWMTSAQNPLFAQAQVNRIWSHLMGRGLVDPVDDFRLTNPASHPELLKALAAEFVQSGFDMRHMIRLIANSRTYQLSSEPNENNGSDEINYSHAQVRRLTAEQLFDGLHQFLGVRPDFRGGDPNIVHASQLPGPFNKRKRQGLVTSAEGFLKQFGQPTRLLACECERTNETTVNHAFTLIGGPEVSRMLSRSDNSLSSLAKSTESAESKIERLYWASLTRPPTKDELATFAPMLANSKNPRATLEDLAWTLVNAKEFVLRR